MSRLWFGLVLLLAGPAAAGTPALLPTADIDLSPYVGRLWTATLHVGRPGGGEPTPVPVRLLFDTGAGRTLLRPDLADSLDLPAAGREAAHRMSGEEVTWLLAVVRLRLDPALTEMPVGLWDVGTVLPEGLPPLDGVFGLDAFIDQRVTLDLAAGRLTAVPVPAPPDRPLRYRARARLATGHEGSSLTVLVEATVGNDPTPRWLLVDSANLDRVRLAPHVLPGDAPDEGTIALVLGSDESGVAAAAVAAEYRRVDVIYDGVVSEAVLRGMHVVLDLAPAAPALHWEPR